MPALLDRVDLLVRLQRVQQVAAVLALQERKSRVRKLRMRGERHRVAQSPRKIRGGGLGSSGFKAGKMPPGGGVNAQIAANGAVPSPATQGFVIGFRQESVGARC